MEGFISVLVVDDHPVFADALRVRLSAERDLRPVSVAYRAAEAEALAHTEAFDVAVLDFKLGDSTGAALAGSLREISPSTAVVILSALDSTDAVVEALFNGIQAWLPKTSDPAYLARVIRRVNAGEWWLEPKTLARVIPRLLALASSSPEDELEMLTGREREVLECLSNAMDRPQIATHLGISENTVRTHVQNILLKLNVHSSVEAVSVFLRTRHGSA